MNSGITKDKRLRFGLNWGLKWCLSLETVNVAYIVSSLGLSVCLVIKRLCVCVCFTKTVIVFSSHIGGTMVTADVSLSLWRTEGEREDELGKTRTRLAADAGVSLRHTCTSEQWKVILCVCVCVCVCVWQQQIETSWKRYKREERFTDRRSGSCSGKPLHHGPRKNRLFQACPRVSIIQPKCCKRTDITVCARAKTTQWTHLTISTVCNDLISYVHDLRYLHLRKVFSS